MRGLGSEAGGRRLAPLGARLHTRATRLLLPSRRLGRWPIPRSTEAAASGAASVGGSSGSADAAAIECRVTASGPTTALRRRVTNSATPCRLAPPETRRLGRECERVMPILRRLPPARHGVWHARVRPGAPQTRPHQVHEAAEPGDRVPTARTQAPGRSPGSVRHVGRMRGLGRA
jgi:hypothetical protein